MFLDFRGRDLKRFQGKAQEDNSTNVIDQEQENATKMFEKTHSEPSFIVKYIELNAQPIFYMMLYTLVLLAVFAERAYCKYQEF